MNILKKLNEIKDVIDNMSPNDLWDLFKETNSYKEYLNNQSNTIKIDINSNPSYSGNEPYYLAS